MTMDYEDSHTENFESIKVWIKKNSVIPKH